MPYAVELVRILAWPTTTLAVVLLLRSEIRSFARTLSGRMESAKTIVLGHRGLEIKGANESASAEVQRRRSRFARFVRSITSKSDLDRICDILQIDSTGDLLTEKRRIITEAAKLATTNDEMDTFSEDLKEITGRDF